MGLYVNVSPSLPYGFYKVHNLDVKKQFSGIEKGEIVLFCLDDELSQYAFERGYINFGSCPGGYAPLGKHVVALPGDKVALNPQTGIKVNGKTIPNTIAQSKDSDGRALETYEAKLRLTENQIIVANETLDSFDSRYYGPVYLYQIVGVLTPYYTF